MRESRFTGRQITTIVVAVALALIALPIGVATATGTLVHIGDPAHPARQAHVTSSGQLLTSVSGTVGSRAVPPARPWSYAEQQAGPSDTALGPTRSTIDVTSLSVTPNGGTQFTLTILVVPGAATDCSVIDSTQQIYMAEGLAAGTPLTASFPTPLEAKAPQGHKICLEVLAPATDVDLSGYFS